jgi:DNA-directed RNA polymerase subunit RPC12/RpoP
VSDFLEFDCPVCGRPHLVDGEELPSEGAYRSCPNCGSQLFVDRTGAKEANPISVRQETRTPQAPHAPGPPPGDSGLALFLKRPTGTVEKLSAEAVQQGIEMQRILPWDLVSSDGRDFTPIQQDTEFRRFFLPSDFSPVAQPRCTSHPDAMPAATCRQCGRSYCSTCATSLLSIKPRLCPACGGNISDPDARLREIPPWQRPKEALRFPIDASAWIPTLLAAATIWAGGFAWFTAPLYLVTLFFLIDALARSSRGAKRWDILSSPPDVKALFQQWMPIAFLTVIVGIPFLAIPYLLGPTFGVLVQFPFTLFLFFYFPMAAGLLLLASDTDQALQPGKVLRTIWSVRDEYFVYLVLFIAVAVAVVAVSIVTSFIPAIGSALQSIALAYGWILQAHLLGFFLYMNRERILSAR